MTLNTCVRKTPVAIESEAVDYPVLLQGKTTGMIVLFVGPKEGTILVGNDPARSHQVAGYRSEQWAPRGFKPFKGSLELSNAD